MTALLPPPGPEDDASSPNSGSHTRSSRRRRIPSVEELLAMLHDLNGLVALRVLSPSQASVIQRNLRILLDTQLKRTQEERLGVAEEALADLCRANPQVLNLLAPFLSDEQVEWLMGEVKDDPHEQT